MAKAMSRARRTEIGTVTKVMNIVLEKAEGLFQEKKS